MDKVNEFEYGVGSETPRVLRHFSEESRRHYLYPSAAELIDTVDDLAGMIKHHKEQQVPRLDILDDYYEGNNSGILRKDRRQEKHLADHRAPHNFAEYVSQFIQGYLVGNPITVQHEDEKVSESLNDLNDQIDGDAHNSDLILDLSIYGRAYELLYRNQDDENQIALLSPLETFVIYSDTVERRPIAAVRYYSTVSGEDTVFVEVYTAEKIYRYETDVYSKTLTYQSEEDQYFDGVPIIEYNNNRFRQGDYEKVLGLIDLYDAAQSDTANYMTDLNDAMLVIKGNLDIDVEEARKMKEANILFLQAATSVDGKEGSADANYIYKQYDVSGVESYKNRIENDIHKFTNTPNMNDEKFGGQQTGEAMKYKLFGLEQKRAIKERLFKRSMMRRYRLLNNMMATSSEGAFDIRGLKITFTPNLPENLYQELDIFFKGGGRLSQETLLSMLSTVSDPHEELARIDEEDAAQQQSVLDNYGFAQTTQQVVGAADGENE